MWHPYLVTARPPRHLFKVFLKVPLSYNPWSSICVHLLSCWVHSWCILLSCCFNLLSFCLHYHVRSIACVCPAHLGFGWGALEVCLVQWLLMLLAELERATSGSLEAHVADSALCPYVTWSSRGPLSYSSHGLWPDATSLWRVSSTHLIIWHPFALHPILFWDTARQTHQLIMTPDAW